MGRVARPSRTPDTLVHAMSFDLAGQLAALKQRANGGRAAILTHDNPDPDSLAAALGLRALFEHGRHRPSTITSAASSAAPRTAPWCAS